MYGLDFSFFTLEEKEKVPYLFADSLEFLMSTVNNNITSKDELVINPRIIEKGLEKFPFNLKHSDAPNRYQIIAPYFISWLTRLKYKPQNTDLILPSDVSLNPDINEPKCTNEWKTMVLSYIYFGEFSNIISGKYFSALDLSSSKVIQLLENGLLLKHLQLLSEDNIDTYLESIRLIFEKNPKHDFVLRTNPEQGAATPLPREIEKDCQILLDKSIVSNKEKSRERYAYHEKSGKVIVFKPHLPNKYHGYPVDKDSIEIPSNVRKLLFS